MMDAKKYSGGVYESSAFGRGISLVITGLFSNAQQAWLRVFWNHYKNVPVFIIFTLVRLVWIPIERIKMYFVLRNSAVDRENLVEVKRILWAVKAQPMDVPRMEYYLATHEGFDDGNVLINENVFLAKVFRDEAIFVDFGKPVHLNYTARKATFLWDEIVQDAVRLLIVPSALFHHISDSFSDEDKIDKRSQDLTILYGTGRCGSTLFVKIIEAVSNEHLVFSEVTAMFDLMSLHLRIPQDEFQRLMLSVIRFLCKSYDPLRRKICLKPLCLSLAMARKIHEVVPNAKFVFLHRDPIQTGLAHERAFGLTPCYRTYQLMHWLPGDWPEWFENRIKFYRNPRVDAVAHRVLTCPSIFETCIMIFANHYLAHKEAAREFPFPALRYETIFEEPEQCIRAFLVMAGLGDKLCDEMVAKAVDSLRFDSQQDRTLAQSQLKGYPVTEIDEKTYRKVAKFCRELGMPEPEKMGRRKNAEKPQISPQIFPRNLSALDGFYPFAS